MPQCAHIITKITKYPFFPSSHFHLFTFIRTPHCPAACFYFLGRMAQLPAQPLSLGALLTLRASARAHSSCEVFSAHRGGLAFLCRRGGRVPASACFRVGSRQRRRRWPSVGGSGSCWCAGPTRWLVSRRWGGPQRGADMQSGSLPAASP